MSAAIGHDANAFNIGQGPRELALHARSNRFSAARADSNSDIFPDSAAIRSLASARARTRSLVESSARSSAICSSVKPAA